VDSHYQQEHVLAQPDKPLHNVHLVSHAHPIVHHVHQQPNVPLVILHTLFQLLEDVLFHVQLTNSLTELHVQLAQPAVQHVPVHQFVPIVHLDSH